MQSGPGAPPLCELHPIPFRRKHLRFDPSAQLTLTQQTLRQGCQTQASACFRPAAHPSDHPKPLPRRAARPVQARYWVASGLVLLAVAWDPKSLPCGSYSMLVAQSLILSSRAHENSTANVPKGSRRIIDLADYLPPSPPSAQSQDPRIKRALIEHCARCRDTIVIGNGELTFHDTHLIIPSSTEGSNG